MSEAVSFITAPKPNSTTANGFTLTDCQQDPSGPYIYEDSLDFRHAFCV